MPRPARFSLLLLWLSALPAHAQTAYSVRVSSGTGFVVNNEGHVVTNAHVVRGCQSISILTPKGEQPATLLAADVTQDLAVLKTEFFIQNVAILRAPENPLKLNEDVRVAGFHTTPPSPPTGYFIKTHVTSLSSPEGSSDWMQLSHATLSGNSGGSVLDISGHVVGVVSSIAEQIATTVGATDIQRADIAVPLLPLYNFLNTEKIRYSYDANTFLLDDKTLHKIAATFSVPILCLHYEIP